MPTAKRKQEARTPNENHTLSHSIGTLREKSLHSELKEWYARPGDRLEGLIDDFHIDIIRGKLLIEIQSNNFSSQKRKLNALTEKHRLRLVFPIAQEKWIVRMAADGTTCLGRRKSPKKGHLSHLFEELVSIPDLVKNPNFSLEVLLIRAEEIRCDDGQGSWRRKGWSIMDRRFLGVLSRHVFREASDFLSLIPAGVPHHFSTKDLAKGIDQPRWRAQKMAYCLRNMGAIKVVGKDGNSLLYAFSNAADA